MFKAASSVGEDVEKIFRTLHVIERNILLNSGIYKKNIARRIEVFNSMSFGQRLIIYISFVEKLDYILEHLKGQAVGPSPPADWGQKTVSR